MELNRREFIQSAVIASTASIPLLSSAAPAPSYSMPLPLGWGWSDDPAKSQQEMAALVISTMDDHLSRYEVLGFEKEPEWNFYQRDGIDCFKLNCTPIVARSSHGGAKYRGR